MPVREVDWADYDSWNEALLEVMYPLTETATPVYLDIEDEQLRQLGERMDVSPEHVVAILADVVARTAELDTPQAFRRHSVRLNRWRGARRSDAPPILPLLSVFSLAAERMTHGEGMSANNYYGRLAELLPSEHTKIGQSYRKVAEPFWTNLNQWLSELEGARGLPTAYSIGFRYAGLAVSQALVRESDRRRLQDFFMFFELAPRSVVPPIELEPLIDAWVSSQDPGPAGRNLTALWRKTALQPRMAEIAATELAEWNGYARSRGTAGGRSRVLLSLQVATFPRYRVRLMPLFFVSDPDRTRPAELLAEDGATTVALEPFDAGAAALADPAIVETADLLEGVLQVVDSADGLLIRQPKRLVVFKKDALSGRWLEASQVLLGDEVVALAAEDYLDEVRKMLTDVARPGWKELQDVAGLPSGWTLLSGIEVFGRPKQTLSAISDLNALVPLTSKQLKLAGGFPLPGNVRNRWHSGGGPEVRAIGEPGLPFMLRLFDLGPVGFDSVDVVELESWSDGGTGSIIENLGELELADGEYAVVMLDEGGLNVLARQEFSLRSSRTPEQRLRISTQAIIHDLTDPLSVLGADEPEDQDSLEAYVHGAIVRSDGSTKRKAGTPERLPWWRAAEPEKRHRAVRLSRPPAGSCFYTGRHHQVLERAESDGRGRPLQAVTTGKCKFCGMERQYSSNYWKNRRQHERRRGGAALNFVASPVLPAVSQITELNHWELALDCLKFLGGGPISMLERVARQIDSSAAFVSQFTLTLEALGHIEIRRSREDLRELTWQASAPAMVEAGAFQVMTGSWAPETEDSFVQRCHELGFPVSKMKAKNAPIKSGTYAQARDFGDWFAENGVAAVGRAGLNLAQVLPTLSSVTAMLPRRSRVPSLGVQWFDPPRAAWIDVDTSDGVGAYRTTGYSRRYFLRTTDDMKAGTIALADPYVAKHAAAVSLGNRALFAYHPETADLIVPLGANLPGMYERAVVLDSQRSPEPYKSYLVYRSVSEDVARHIAHLLEN